MTTPIERPCKECKVVKPHGEFCKNSSTCLACKAKIDLAVDVSHGLIHPDLMKEIDQMWIVR